MTKDQYFAMCEEMGRDPDPDKIPLELDDFPYEVQEAFVIYNKLGDRIASDIGYLGKDYSPLSFFMEIAGIETRHKELVLEIILRIDNKIIEDSRQMMDQERKKLKQQSSGNKVVDVRG